MTTMSTMTTMTTMTTTLDPVPVTTDAEHRERTRTPAPRIRARGVVHGEWIKFWSVRSTSVTLVAAGIVTVAFGMIFSAVAESDSQAPGPAAFLTNPVDVALGGVGLTEMIVGVLGVMMVAGEYSTGLIRTWFVAGQRGRVLRAKVVVLAASVFAVAGVAVTAAVAAGQAVYVGSEPTVPVIEALDVVFGTTIYLTGIALIGIALGFILRSTAAGIGTLVGAVFIGPNLLNLLPESMTDHFVKYLPSEAGSAMMTQVSDPDLLSRSMGYAVFVGWIVGLLALAGWLVQRRDA